MGEKVIFYTTHCPRCKVLEIKLKQKNISYEECDNVNEMLENGIKAAPALKIEKKDLDTCAIITEILDFNKAISWINSRSN